jgi:uncharacterized protein (TIGR02145 family)/prepilin-type N-terminal cleavage/methylation domain-containing protein
MRKFKLLVHKTYNSKKQRAFTIIELLVVVVIIGVLAAITIVAYSGMNQRAIGASLASDLSNAAIQLKMFYAENSLYPGTVRCDIPDSSTNKCIKTSTGNTFDYTPNNASNPPSFSLTATNTSGAVYIVTDSTAVSVPVSLADSDPDNWLAIGTQVWAKANLNVGTRIAGATAQTNNSILEKWCYSNNESNCTTYGGLYLWDEAMQYVTTEGAQGICPTGSHIPSDNDWKILEVQLGMTQGQADTPFIWRGTDQGTQLKPGGSSGLNIPLAGSRTSDGSFVLQSYYADLWSSSKSGSTEAWVRELRSIYTTVLRSYIAINYNMGYGFLVRCVGN